MPLTHLNSFNKGSELELKGFVVCSVTMAPITKEVILSDLDRAKFLIDSADHKFNIVPKEIEKLVARYEILFKKWNSTNCNVVDHDLTAARIIERDGITLENDLQPIT